MENIWAFVVIAIPGVVLLGLRHALDIDHVTAIDSLVRMYRIKQHSRWLGTAFSTGHMVSVLFQMIFIIAIAGSITSTGYIAFWGGIIGIISLGAIGVINVLTMKKWGKTGSVILANKVLHRISFLGPFRSSFITGMVFGFGFDTATQISTITMSVVASVTLGLQAALVLASFFALGMISLDTLDSVALRSVFSKIFHKKIFRNISYGLSGCAVVVAFISSYELVNNAQIFPSWAGPSLAGGIIAASFVYSLVTHS
ncbi:MAG: hypothetical protein E6K98_03560 [Thaumarchaeota archaeon]|nr:MAG: hypothetical protein E6K98_03560 [Nitrososphaerota archaeon]TLX94959.1 MAG: hypothetical protein E6K91_04655 [Nitrososphaerota archaeon]